ncbi:MAG: serine/threonine-protein kinase [Bradymonadia bacterium]
MSADLGPPGGLQIGQIVAGRYRIEGQIGQGGTGTVYRATHLALEREVAVKILLPQRQTMSVYRARFEREARVASALQHPGAVHIYDFGEDEGALYLVMALLTGQTLRQALGTGNALPYAQTLQVTRGLVDLLVAAHGMGLVHRDLKPENIFLEPIAHPRRDGPESQVMVVDFGLAYIEDDDTRGRVTESGMMSGTPQYMSPEQCRSKEVGAPSDIYALGCILYELLTGQLPFDGALFEIMSAHLYTPPVAPSLLPGAEEIPRVMDDLVMRLLRKRPSDRPSAPDVLRVVDAIIGRAGGRERGRDIRMLGDRATRMLATPPPRLVASTPAPLPTGGAQVGVCGTLSNDLQLALKLNGVVPVSLSDPTEEAPPVILALTLEPEALPAWLATGRQVVTAGDPSDVEGLTRLLRMGVAEVVPHTATAAEVVSRVKRALRRAKRGQRR